MNEIKFSWAGKKYKIVNKAREVDVIVLPNKVVLETNWIGSRLVSAIEVEHSFEHSNPGQIAEYMNGVLARETND